MTDAERVEQLENAVDEMEDFVCTFLAIALRGSISGEGKLTAAAMDAVIGDFAHTREKNGQHRGSRLADRLRGIMDLQG